jgi:hypothetical protein
MPSGQKNATESAESYLEGQAFSKRGLIDQLKFEKFTSGEALGGASARPNAPAYEAAAPSGTAEGSAHTRSRPVRLAAYSAASAAAKAVS